MRLKFVAMFVPLVVQFINVSAFAESVPAAKPTVPDAARRGALLPVKARIADDSTKRKAPVSAYKQRFTAPARCSSDTVLGTSRIVQIGAPGGLQIGVKTYPQTLHLRDREVVLTFDDGPLPATTSKVLNALKAQCVRATFFLIGRNAKANPQMVRREIAEGHSVGHHTFSHPHVTLRGLPADAAIKNIVDGFSAVEQAAYGTDYAGGTPRVPFFRFPGFADTPATLGWLGKNGIATFGTDLWASDWTPMSPDSELQLVLHRLEKRGRGILLFHDTQRATAKMLPDFLRELKRRGFRIVHLVPASDARPALEQASARWHSETEAILKKIMPRLVGNRRVQP